MQAYAVLSVAVETKEDGKVYRELSRKKENFGVCSQPVKYTTRLSKRESSDGPVIVQ